MGWIAQAFHDDPFRALTVLGFAVYLPLVLLEAGWGRLRQRKLYDFGETIINFSTYAGFFMINTINGLLAFFVFSWAYDHRVADLGAGGLAWLLLAVLDDFTFYWFHRALHSGRLLWASHQPHHSSEHFNLSAAFRQGWMPFFFLPFWLPLAFLGFDPLLMLFTSLVNQWWQAGLHTQLIPKLGPLERVFNTPSHHRVHHGANAGYRDRNLGGVLIVWDRLFGTYAEEQEAVRYGLVQPLRTDNPFNVALGGFSSWWREVRAARSVREIIAATL